MLCLSFRYEIGANIPTNCDVYDLYVTSGQVFVFSNAKNVVVGEQEDMPLMTRVPTNCEKYKEGKFVLEKSKIAENNLVGIYCSLLTW
ncbi:hypothetical protein V2J09_008505 [Rumex salicifolius]